MMLFDTHLHLIYLDRLSYPWLDDLEALKKPSTFDTYTQNAPKLGIGGCLHMEVDVAEAQIRDETAMIAELCKLPGSLLRGAISSCRPEYEQFPEFLEWATDTPTIRGFRRILHVMPDELSQSDLFRANVKLLSGTGLPFDLCVRADQIPIATALVDHCPEVQFVLDHCGVPDVKSGVLSPWAENISALAERANVAAKISGVIAYGDGEACGLDDLAPFIGHIAESFGHDRIVWGSDSPVCNLGGGLEKWVAITRAWTADWPDDDRRALFSGNARRIWQI